MDGNVHNDPNSSDLITDSNNWEKIISRGDGPGCLQGHSMVEHQDTLYVFGGELSFCNDQETPLWMYDIKVQDVLV